MGAAARLLSALGGLFIGWWLTAPFTAPRPTLVRPTSLHDWSRRPRHQARTSNGAHTSPPVAHGQPPVESSASYALQLASNGAHTSPLASNGAHTSPPPVAHRQRAVESSASYAIRLTENNAIAPSALPLPENLPALDLPDCMWKQLALLCRSRFRSTDPSTRAEWDGATKGGILRCITNDRYLGRFKRSNVELEVQFLRGCVDDVLQEKPPPVGTSSLPREALERSLRLWSDVRRPRAVLRGQSSEDRVALDSRRSAASLDSADLVRVRERLASGNESISILALGASVTFMFADLCAEADSQACSTGPHETLQKFDSRIHELRRRRSKPMNAEEADWLVQFVRTLKVGFPNTRLSARSVAYGGMNPKAVAACAADFVAPPSGGSGSHDTHAPPRDADLVILDFAIFGGLHPTSEDWHSIESLVRALWTLDVAVILLNMPVWCLGETGERRSHVHGHTQCQRMIFNRTLSRTSIAAAELPEKYDATLRAVALNYKQTSISVFDALQPLIADGSLNLVDFTHDGKHPIMYPRGTRRGSVYSRYIADLLAHAVEPSLLGDERGNSIWHGRSPAARDAMASLGGPQNGQKASWRVLPRIVPAVQPAAHRRAQPLPPALTPGLASSTRGIRCYGWGARATRGSWKSIILSDIGWNLTREELAYDEIAAAWKPLPIRRFKPGLTSVSHGDSMTLHIDTSLDDSDSALGRPSKSYGSGNEHAMVQLTYLQSYEQVGMLRIECVSGCNCTEQRLQTLEPSRLATLNTSLWRVSESRKCKLRFTNVSPNSCGAARGPCTKVKLVALAVAAAPSTLDSAAAAAAAAQHIMSAVGLDFL